MDAVRRTTTVRQMELLVEFAEAHRDLALGRLRSKEARALAVRLWRECAQILNSEGPARTHREWSKVWNDTKCRVKTKLTAAAVARRGTGGGPFNNVILSAIEERVAEIIGRDIGPLPNCGQEQLADATNDEEDDTTVDSFIVLNNIDYDDEMPGPSGASLRPPPPPPPSSQLSPSPSLLATLPAAAAAVPSLAPSSATSTPSRRRQRPRQRPRTGDRPSRIRLPATTSRDVLDESRAMVLRIEELRARTDSVLAEAALIAAQAAKAQAEASLLQSRAVESFIINMMPAVRLFIQTLTRREQETTEAETSNLINT